MITVNRLSKSYPSESSEDFLILDNIDFKIETGQSVAITGSSGSGKTTLLSLLAGLDSIDPEQQGEIIIDGQSITDMDENQITLFRAKHLGFIFQNFYLLPHLNVFENVSLPLDILGQPNVNEKVLELLDLVGLSHRKHVLPNTLSGGERQRVAIARALINQPKLVLADEPTGNLDTKTGKIITDLLFNLVDSKNITLLLVTHDLNLAKLCDRNLILDDAKLLDD